MDENKKLINKELEETRQIVAVLLIEDIEGYLWEEQSDQLYELLSVLADGRKQDEKLPSQLLARVVKSKSYARGKWYVTDAYPHRLFCSECHKTNVFNIENTDGEYPRYCMWCGTKMDKVDEE